MTGENLSFFDYKKYGNINVADFYTYVGDAIPDILTRELTTLENKLNFLGEITGLSTERQIKVQKEIAKGTYYKLMHNVIGLGKIFNVDIPEL